MLPEFEQRRVEHLLAQFYDRRVLAHFQHQARLGHVIRGTSVTLVEFRPRFDDPAVWLRLPVAQFRLDTGTGLWSLYWRDRNRRWHLYDQCPPARNFERLLAEVDRDATHIFWG